MQLSGKRHFSYLGGLLILVGNCVPWWCSYGFSSGCTPYTHFSLANAFFTNSDLLFLIVIGLSIVILAMNRGDISKTKIVWVSVTIMLLIFAYLVFYNHWFYHFVDWGIFLLSIITVWLVFYPSRLPQQLKKIAQLVRFLFLVMTIYRIWVLSMKQVNIIASPDTDILQLGLPIILFGLIFVVVSQ